MGPDDIHYEFFNQLPDISLTYLLDIFNNIWTNSNISNLWKQAIIIPILKTKKDPSTPSNYRPISLISCLCRKG